MSMMASIGRVSTSVSFSRGLGVRLPLHVGCTAQAHCHEQEKGPHGDFEEESDFEEEEGGGDVFPPHERR